MTDSLKTEKRYSPKIGFDFFYFDPCGDGIVYFKTEQRRDEEVKAVVKSYLDDGWNEEVESVTVGKITGAAAKVDVIFRPVDLDENDCADDGVHWDPDWEYTCNYEIRPLGYVCHSNKVLNESKP